MTGAKSPRIVTSVPAALRAWSLESRGAEGGGGAQTELVREYRFPSFRAAIRFMAAAAPRCDAMDHHPRWENVWRTVTVRLSTWDAGGRVTARDVALATALDAVFARHSRAAAGKTTRLRKPSRS